MRQGRSSPADPISGARYTAIGRSFLPSQPLPCKGRSFSAPKINVTPVLASGLGAGVRGSAPGPARLGHTGPAKPRTLPGRERWRIRRSLGGLRERDLNGADQGRNPRAQKLDQKRDARSSPPRVDGRCGAQLPDFPLGFSFANQLPGRLSGAETGGAAGSVHFLPTPGPICSPPQSPRTLELARLAPLSPPRCGARRGGSLNLGESLSRCKRGCSRAGVKEIEEPVSPTSRFRAQIERNNRGGSTSPATSAPYVGSQGAFPIVGEKLGGAPILNVRNQDVVSQHGQGPSRPTTPSGFWGFPGVCWG